MRPSHSKFLLLPIVVAAMVLGCGRKPFPGKVDNQLPEVRLTAAPIDTTGRYFYSYLMDWVGYDPDGRVDHYLYAIDPPSEAEAETDTEWVTTRDNEKRIQFNSTQPIPAAADDPHRFAQDPHTFVIKAIDNKGAEGPSVYRSFFSFTEAPDVNLLNPPPGPFENPVLTPSVRFTWGGIDRDGVQTSKPVQYKFLLLSDASAFPIQLAINNPDSLRRYYAPHFVGWDSTSGDTTETTFTRLSPGHRYLFVVIGFDEAGAYSPVFKLEKNMLRFTVGYAATLGPIITMFNEFFDYTYPSGGFCVCREAEFDVELPADQRITVNWFAKPPSGATITCYRWMVDGDVNDERPRRDERTDLTRWSLCSSNVRSVTLGPYSGNEEHRLYIEAKDDIGLRSLGILHYTVVRSSLDHELGIVNDTRFVPDIYDVGNTDCPQRPRGFWPRASELDTFLFARGGTPWQCYPPGTMTTPGLFSGYDFGVINSRRKRSALAIKLSELGQYRHLIWLTDGQGARFLDPQDPIQGETSLHYMSSARQFNSLGAYVKQGGKLWGAGGGFALASQLPWNDDANDIPSTTFSHITGKNRELDAGRVMWELPHWQSEIRISTGRVNPARFRGRFEYPQSASDTTSASWIPYWKLPRSLRRKADPPADPVPPQRTSGDVNQTVYDFEYLQVPNYIIENVGDDPDVPVEASTLDTLYEVKGQGVPPPNENLHNVVMTYYHGPAVPQGMVFSGFNLWSFKRSDCRALVDFVFQELWRLNPNAGPRPMRAAADRSRATAPAALETVPMRDRNVARPSVDRASAPARAMRRGDRAGP
jgi:hypothetical protein